MYCCLYSWAVFFLALPSPGKSPTAVSPNHPTNLLGTFLTFSSLILQYSKGLCLYTVCVFVCVCLCLCVYPCFCVSISVWVHVCVSPRLFVCGRSCCSPHAGERSEIHSRLCLIILTCVVEDQFANAFLHDPNISFPVTLQRAVRHSRVCVYFYFIPYTPHSLCFIENFVRSDNQKVHLWLAQCWVRT